MKKFLLFLATALTLYGATTITLAQLRKGPTTGTFVLTSINSVVSWGPPTTVNFADAEVPTGTINGTNTVFTLAHAPVGTSLELTLNGIVQQAGASNDYVLSGSTITFNAIASIPNVGDSIQTWYRY